MSDLEFQTVYNTSSFSLVSMAATTTHLWFRAYAVADRYKSAVAFIAAYYHMRIFNFWVKAMNNLQLRASTALTLTGIPFNDACRYMDWLLTVPLLLLEICLLRSSSQTS